jgi:WXG100 family type VII secretion target
MSCPKVRSDFDQLNNIADTFSSQSDAISQMNQNLKSKMEQLRGGDWVGKGATKFYNEMDSSVMPSLQRLQNALSQASSVTRKIGQLMKQTEDEAARVFVIVVN